MQYRLISLDLDGTLLGPDREVSAASRRELARVAALDTAIMISSGRILPEARACAASVPEVAYVSACNGAVVYDARARAVIDRSPIAPESYEPVLKRLDGSRLFFSAYGEDTVYVSAPSMRHFPLIARHVEGFRCRTVRSDDIAATIRADGSPIYKLYVMGLSPWRLRQARAFVRSRGDLELSRSHASNMEITAKHVDKARALGIVAAALGLGLERTMAIGDGDNDIPMLRRAGLSVAMGNASRRVKRTARATTLSNAEDGVAEAIRLHLA